MTDYRRRWFHRFCGREPVTGNLWLDMPLIGLAVNGQVRGRRWVYVRIHLGPAFWPKFLGGGEFPFLCIEVGPGDFEDDDRIRPRWHVVR